MIRQAVELICGDCLEAMQGRAENSVDMILADLPYGTTACRWDTVIPFRPLWEQYKRIIKPRSAIVLFGSQPFTSALIMSNIKWFRYEWIWAKRRTTGFLNATHRPLSAHESIVVFGEGKLQYAPQMRIGRRHKRNRKIEHQQNTEVYSGFQSLGITWTNEFYPTSVIEFGADPETTITRRHRPNKEKRHPTQKPVALLQYLIYTYTIEGETVMDNVMGVGSTGVACVKTGRSFWGCEIDETYFRIAEKRIAEAQMQPRLIP